MTSSQAAGTDLPSDGQLVDKEDNDDEEIESNEEDIDWDDDFTRTGPGFCAKAISLWYVIKVIVNVVFPICWVTLGAYYAADYFALYYTDADDGEWDGLNSADKEIAYFSVTAIFIVAVSLLISLILHLMNFVSFQIYFEICSSATILVYGLVVYYTNVNNTSEEFFYSEMNGWAAATIALAGFMLLYHLVIYLKCRFPCCCRGQVCCDWDNGFVEEAESELDRMERAGAGRTDMLGPGDENHEKHLNDQYAERAQKRAEKRERRKFRESKRKERRKRKAERMRNEREEWIKLQQRSYFCW